MRPAIFAKIAQYFKAERRDTDFMVSRRSFVLGVIFSCSPWLYRKVWSDIRSSLASWNRGDSREISS